MKKFQNIGNPFYSSIAVAVFMVVWEIFTRTKNIKEYILPAPSAS
ncbi:hydroxymethylpyrimidine ABC transporter [Acetivibrio straminisolvens JCM 21531]|uniref:Hydroxymethylpyrimidine ABC transporter n=1 Tax=Acetivibrio straminisolvens JCM 21531 TaxID=1294263 RepID=W4VAQ6_9FIRM|nr:hydroxymethylpyrimidine ABC transporter [Acetivibrio straminisolvens JCM 21531]